MVINRTYICYNKGRVEKGIMIEVRNRRVIVVGTGKSGIGSAVLLEKNGALPVLYYGN